MEANRGLFDDLKLIFQTFSKRLYTGMIGEDGLDPSGVYWVPSSTSNVNKHIHRLTAITRAESEIHIVGSSDGMRQITEEPSHSDMRNS
ncbi:hypothetical protein PVK63_16445 [Aliivibrio sp. S2TY2]|uniref:hypothetical protein n=1 Tax=unclassified Aliivibrio TaxID=2645654 RepID=UPI002377DDC1|nr:MULTISPECIES: hypothetical protein [unclassified Aliivibrio]MDD9176460.1 hypothetical protein [Aliivibrio sp. S3TY1]MDD9193538.1 hypothetical protein [Aliivibrio sp. S2TY2]